MKLNKNQTAYMKAFPSNPFVPPKNVKVPVTSKGKANRTRSGSSGSGPGAPMGNCNACK